jgi:type IV secretion system protein VirB2
MNEGPPEYAIVAAVSWVQATLLGSIATAVATIAVASIGYLAFSGRMDLRRGLQVILGCFVVFSAPAIAAGLQGLASALVDETSAAPPALSQSAPVLIPLQPTNDARPAYDPYAGAAVAPD